MVSEERPTPTITSLCRRARALNISRPCATKWCRSISSSDGSWRARGKWRCATTRSATSSGPCRPGRSGPTWRRRREATRGCRHGDSATTRSRTRSSASCWSTPRCVPSAPVASHRATTAPVGRTDAMAPELATLVRPATTALVLQELQEGVVGASSALPALAAAATETGLIDRAVATAKAARTAGVRVVHCTAENLAGAFGVNRNARLFAGVRNAGAANEPGSPSVAPLTVLGPETNDIVLPRYHGLSPMTGTQLDTLLRNEGITTVVVAGVSTNIAIPNLVFDAVNRSFQVVLLTDVVAGVPVTYTEEIIRNSLGLVATL